MVELGDHQLLAFLRGAALARREVGELEDHLQKGDAQALRDAQVRRRPRRRLAAHDVLPDLEALARRQARAERP
jgi:hypothetical protein